MTEPRRPVLSPAVQRRLEQSRQRRAAMAADRAALESRRQHGLEARKKAKLAYLSTRDQAPADPPKEEVPQVTEPENDAA